MSKKVVLFACIEKNIGDDLFIYVIANRYKKCNFIISSEADYGSLKELPNLVFDDNLKEWIKYNNYTSRNPFKELIRICYLKKYTALIGHFDVATYIVGNAFKNKKYKGNKDSRWIKERVNLSDKFYLLSTNFGPYTDDRWVKDCEHVFQNITDICFRDYNSYNIFRSLPASRYKPDAILSIGRKKHLKCNYVVVSMIDCSFSERPDDIQKKRDAFENKIKTIVNHYLSIGKKVVLLNSNTVQDLPASQRVYDSVNDPDNLSIFNYLGNLESVFELYSNAEYVIATRLHTIILAWIYSIPVLPIVYDIKVKGLLNECGFRNYYIDISEIEKLNINKIDTVFAQYNYHLSDDIIEEANKQFVKLDEELID